MIENWELRTILTQMGEKLSEDDADEIIRRIDKDGDGSLDYHEFCELFKVVTDLDPKLRRTSTLKSHSVSDETHQSD